MFNVRYIYIVKYRRNKINEQLLEINISFFFLQYFIVHINKLFELHDQL